MGSILPLPFTETTPAADDTTPTSPDQEAYSKFKEENTTPPNVLPLPFSNKPENEEPTTPGFIENVVGSAKAVGDQVEGIFNNIKNDIKHSWDLTSNSVGLRQLQEEKDALSAKRNAAIGKAASDITEEALTIASPFTKDYTRVGKLAEQVEKAKGAAGETTAEFKEHPASSIMGVPFGIAGYFVGAFGELTELTTGKSNNPDMIRNLNTDELAASVKTTVANATLAAAGELVGAARGSLLIRGVKSVAIGAGEGMIYGALDKANTPDALKAGIANAIVFSTVGGVLGMIGGDPAKRENEIRSSREIAYDTNKSFKEIGAAIEAISTTESVDEAASRSAATTEKPTILNGEVGDIVKGAEGNVAVSDEGSVLVNPNKVPPQQVEPWMVSPATLWHSPEEFFKKTGFLPNQTVSYNGADYTLRNIGDNVATISDGDKWYEVDKNDIRANGDVNINPHSEGPITGIRVIKATTILNETAKNNLIIKIAKTKALVESPTIPGTRTGVLNSVEEGGVPIFSQKFLTKVANSEFAKGFSKLLTEYTPQIFRRIYETVSNAPQFGGTRFLGIGTDPGLLGYNALWGVLDSAKRAVIAEHFGSIDLASEKLADVGYTVNPFMHDDLNDMIGTVVHEIVHNWWLHNELDPNEYKAQGGGPDKMFEATLEQAMKNMPDLLGEMHDKLNELIINGSDTLDWYDSEFYNLKREYLTELHNGAEQQRRTNEARQIFNERRNARSYEGGEKTIPERVKLPSISIERESSFGNQRRSNKGEEEGITRESDRIGNEGERTFGSEQRPIQQLANSKILQYSNPFGQVQEQAASNNMSVDENGIVRDRESGKILSKGGDSEKAYRVIQKSGQASGPDLSPPDSPPPPNASSMPTPSEPGKPYLNPGVVRGPGMWEKLVKNVEILMPWQTKKSALFRDIDTLHNTQLFAKVWDPIYNQTLVMANAMRPIIQIARDITNKAKGMNPLEQSKIFYYREALSVRNILDGDLGRIPTTLEVQTALRWSDKADGEPVDLQKLYTYTRERKEINEQYQTAAENMQDPANPGMAAIHKQQLQDLQERQKALIDKHNITEKEYKVAQEMDDIRKRGDLDKESLLYISNLAERYMNPELDVDRNTYASKNGLSGTHLEIANSIDALYNKLGDIFGIENNRRLGAFTNHYRAYGEAPDEVKSLRQRPGLVGNYDRAFASSMIRSGEIYDFVDNPFVALANYINQGYKTKYMNPVIDQATKDAVIEANKIDNRGHKLAALENARQYIDGAKGKPPVLDKAFQDGAASLLKAVGINISDDAVARWSNAMLSWTSASMLGGKPELAARDMGTHVILYGSRFGPEWLADNIMAMGDGRATKVMEEGKAAGISANDFKSMQEMWQMVDKYEAGTSAKITDFMQKAGEVAIKYNGQKNVFTLTYASTYASVLSKVTPLLKSFYSGELTSQEFAKAAKLNTFDAPIANQFIELVNKGEELKAVEFLSRQAAVETAFIHGFNDHPYLWNSVVGRLFGQFGTYPVSAINYVGRMATRGSMGQRALSMGAFVAATAAVKEFGDLLGFDLSNWSALHGLGKYGVFVGGPIVQNMSEPLVLAKAAASSFMGAESTKAQQEAADEFRKTYGLKYEEDGTLTWDADRFKNGFRSLWVPGSYAFHNWVDAVDMAKGGYGILPVVGRAAGFNLGTDGKDFLTSYRGGTPPDRDANNVPILDIINPMAQTITHKRAE